MDIVLACTILHNYISTVDPFDKFLNEEIIIHEEHGDIVDEDVDTIIIFSNTMTTR